jgi:hypothetical protein
MSHEYYEYFTPEIRCAGFVVKELLGLRRVLDERRITLDQAIAEIRENDREREWREFFGDLTVLWT